MTWTELHDACEHQDVSRIIKALNCEDALKVDEHGFTPLHILCWGNPDTEAVKSLLKTSPQAACDRDAHGDTPLHVACSCANMDELLVEILLDACPSAASMPNREGLMPLHVACRHAPRNAGVIRRLIEAYPPALKTHIKMGNPAPKKSRSLRTCKSNDHIPLDPSGGMATKASTDIRFEATTQVRDGAYPIHMAIAANASLDVMEMLVKAADEDLLLKTNKFGETPLNLALKHHMDEDIVLLLIQAGPKAVQICDKEHGNTAVHTASTVGASPRIVKALLDPWHAIIYMLNADGLRPLFIGLSSGKCSEEVLELLEIKQEDEG